MTLKALNSLQNKDALINMVASQNPMVQQIVEMGKSNGGNYDAITATLLQNAGFDAQAVQRQLKTEGII